MKFLIQILIALIIATIGMIITLSITKRPTQIFIAGWIACCVADLIFAIININKDWDKDKLLKEAEELLRKNLDELAYSNKANKVLYQETWSFINKLK